MKRFFSTKYHQTAHNFGLLLLRILVGVFLMHHGFSKISHFDTLKDSFMSFMGLGSTVSVSLIIFAEFLGGLFLILGLFTRLVCIPIIIGMAVAAFVAKGGDIFGAAELPMLYMILTIVVLFTGPGKYSLDGGIWK